MLQVTLFQYWINIVYSLQLWDLFAHRCLYSCYWSCLLHSLLNNLYIDLFAKFRLLIKEVNRFSFTLYIGTDFFAIFCETLSSVFSLKWKKPQGSEIMPWFPSIINSPETAAFVDYTKKSAKWTLVMTVISILNVWSVCRTTHLHEIV